MYYMGCQALCFVASWAQALAKLWASVRQRLLECEAEDYGLDRSRELSPSTPEVLCMPACAHRCLRACGPQDKV